MATPLPYLRNTSGGLNAQVLYPFTRTVSFLTTIQPNFNGSEQRWAERPPLAGFDIPMSSLVPADKASWLTAFSTAKGRQEQDLQITLGSTAYSNLALMSDSLTATNQNANLFDQRLQLRQVANGSWTPPTPGTVFPSLGFGGVAQKPFSQISTYLTSLNDSPYGPRFAFSWYGASITNFPAGYLRSWRINYPLLTAADLSALEGLFLSQCGRLTSFNFPDPIDSTTYHNVRFDMDDLSIRYVTTTQFATEITLLQTNGS